MDWVVSYLLQNINNDELDTIEWVGKLIEKESYKKYS
jgi:hypothetical protein